MPKAPGATAKKLKKGEPSDEGLPVVDDAALAALDDLLNEGTPVTKKEKAPKGKPAKAVEEDLGLPDFGDEPDTSEIEGLDAGTAGISARLDSLVEHLSDYHNSTSNRLESMQTTLKSVLELVQVRLDEMQSIIEAMASRPAAATPAAAEEEEGIDITDDKAIAKAIGWTDVARVSAIMSKCRTIKSCSAGNFIAWLQKAGMPEKAVLKFGELFDIDANSMVSADTFQ